MISRRSNFRVQNALFVQEQIIPRYKVLYERSFELFLNNILIDQQKLLLKVTLSHKSCRVKTFSAQLIFRVGKDFNFL